MYDMGIFPNGTCLFKILFKCVFKMFMRSKGIASNDVFFPFINRVLRPRI